jgi:hypothetical protein
LGSIAAPVALQPSMNSDNAPRGIANILVLPNAHDCPAGALELSGDLRVTRDIPCQLHRPVRGVLAGLVAMLSAAMPEASVNEHRELDPQEDDVNVAKLLRRANGSVLTETEPATVEL